MLAAAFQSLQAGDFVRSEMLGRQCLQGAPNDEGALLVVALSLDAQNRPQEALPLFAKLAESHPGTGAHWSNYGNALRMQGQVEQARTALERALALDPNDAPTNYNLSLIELESGQFHRARVLLQRAHQAEPSDPVLRAAFANAAFLSGDSEEAERVLQGWQQWTAGDALTCADVAWTYLRMSIAAPAEEALEQAARLLPNHPKVQIRRVAFLERANRLDEASGLLERIDEAVAARLGLQEELRIVRAQLASRGTDMPAAMAQFESITSNPATARRHPELLSSLARMHDASGDVEGAMRTIARAHAVQMDELRSHAPHWLEPGADPLDITRYRLSAADATSWQPVAAPDASASPIFVVGFPRSGTTMLETMLDAHPLLVSMDERSFLQNLVESMRSAGLRYPEDLGKLDDTRCQQLRDTYWRLVGTRVTLQPGQRLVDKNPLNILRLPLIRRLFPNAKILLALRHPCDVVLSNYLQTFRSPAYIALCATLDSTARGYADTFDFWIDQAGVLRPDVMELRYEDIVDDIEAQSRRIAEFLGLEWSQSMVEFDQRAKERGYIGTPSYHQVVEPLNRKGIARWERYRSHLQPVLPHLQPYLERWGYSA